MCLCLCVSCCAYALVTPLNLYIVCAYICSLGVPLHAGKPLSKCGKCKRYMKYISQRPSRLYCPSCEEVYPVPQVGCMSPSPLRYRKLHDLLPAMKLLASQLLCKLCHEYCCRHCRTSCQASSWLCFIISHANYGSWIPSNLVMSPSHGQGVHTHICKTALYVLYSICYIPSMLSFVLS